MFIVIGIKPQSSPFFLSSDYIAEMKRVNEERAKKEEERKAEQNEKFEKDLKKGGKTILRGAYPH